MRIFSIEKDGTFKEYSEIPFQKDHEEAILENWLETNPNCLKRYGMILKRQACFKKQGKR